MFFEESICSCLKTIGFAIGFPSLAFLLLSVCLSKQVKIMDVFCSLLHCCLLAEAIVIVCLS